MMVEGGYFSGTKILPYKDNKYCEILYLFLSNTPEYFKYMSHNKVTKKFPG